MIDSRNLRRLVCGMSIAATAALLTACSSGGCCGSCGGDEAAMLDANGNVVLAADSASCSESCSSSCSEAKSCSSSCSESCSDKKAECSGDSAMVCPVTGTVMTTGHDDN